MPFRPAAILALLAGCGSGGGPIDCAWLQGPNCWKVVVSAVIACRPPRSAEGAFSADRRSCTYASGETVSFPAPVANPPQPPFDFSIGTCVTVDHPDADTVRITTRGGVARIHYLSAAREVTCPAGSLHSADLGPQSPLIGCDRAEALLPDVGLIPYEGPLSTASFFFRGSDTAPYSATVWRCH